jgi:hypothetical protein
MHPHARSSSMDGGQAWARSVSAVFLAQALEDAHDVRPPVLYGFHVLLAQLLHRLAVHLLAQGGGGGGGRGGARDTPVPRARSSKDGAAQCTQLAFMIGVGVNSPLTYGAHQA